jgi:uncharacterized membrane protein
MHKLINPGRIMFATGILGLGVLCLISKDFIIGRPHAWPEGWEVNPALGMVTGIIAILAAVAIILKNRGGLAALVLASLTLLFSVLRDLPFFMSDWLNGLKALALLGGALIVASSFFKEEGNVATEFRVSERVQKNFITIGCLMLALFFVAGGYAHFKFAEFVKNFIPAYIPFHSFWTYFCGLCLFAGGIGLLIPFVRRWAALLSGIMVLGWFLLLHIPRFLDNMADASDRMGLCESFAFVGIFFVLAGILSEKH